MTNVSDLYDKIYNEYKLSKTCEFRRVESENFTSLMKDHIQNELILDLACGDGFFTRIIALNARYVLGIDISKKMIDLATVNTSNPPNTSYFHADVLQLPSMIPVITEFLATKGVKMNENGRVNVITAAYLLNYCRSKNELREMVNVLYQLLEDGGRFLSVNDNPHDDPSMYGAFELVGMRKSVKRVERVEGDLIAYSFFVSDAPEKAADITNYWISPDTIKQVFEEEGFREFRWVPVVWNHPDSKLPKWQGFLSNCPVICMEAIK